MELEKVETKKHWLTDRDRDAVLKLIGCGLTMVEIAEISHISRSSIQYIRQAHTACINEDWSTLQRLSTVIRPTVDWAMKVTGKDKAFLEAFPKEDTPTEAPKTEPAPVVVTREDFLAMYATMQDIRSLLSEIRDILK